MTTIAMKSRMNRDIFQRRGNICSMNTYYCTVECEDNEQHSFEVDADSYGEACAIADSLAQELCANIQLIQVQQLA